MELVPIPTDDVLSPGAQERISRAVPAKTKAAYAYQGRRWIDWCTDNGLSALPATPDTLASYVSHLADLGLAPATIEQAIATIRTAHREAGYKGHPDTGRALRVLTAHQKDWAEAGKRKKKAPAITVPALRAMIDATDPDTLIGLRDRALMVLGFSMVTRRSELAALRINELTFTDDGIIALIRYSKTDQSAAGVTVHIPPGSHPDTDPVRVVKAWLAALDGHGITDGPLLRQVNRWGTPGAGMSGAAINARVRHLAAKAELPNADKFTAHGLRSGGATESARAGHPTAFIAEHGRWSKNSTQVLEYIQMVDKWRDNPMRGIGL